MGCQFKLALRECADLRPGSEDFGSAGRKVRAANLPIHNLVWGVPPGWRCGSAPTCGPVL